MYLLIGCIAYNLGNGKGISVLEMVAAFEKVSGKVIFLSTFFKVLSLQCIHLLTFQVLL